MISRELGGKVGKPDADRPNFIAVRGKLAASSPLWTWSASGLQTSELERTRSLANWHLDPRVENLAVQALRNF